MPDIVEWTHHEAEKNHQETLEGTDGGDLKWSVLLEQVSLIVGLEGAEGGD